VPAGRVGVSRGARSVGGAREASNGSNGEIVLYSTSPCVALCYARGGREDSHHRKGH
ncbi:unnamed protein product, partial [Ectocarpus sp. 8 AP-2014]